MPSALPSAIPAIIPFSYSSFSKSVKIVTSLIVDRPKSIFYFSSSAFFLSAFVGYKLILQDFALNTLKCLAIVAAVMFGNVMGSLHGALLENPSYIGKYNN